MNEIKNGSIVALVTPMHEDGSLDFTTYKKLIDFHIENNSSGVVAVGTTGESPTVNFEEHLSLIEVAVNQSAGRIPVIAGTGANSTSEAVELTKEASKLGVNSTLQVVPYYNKPSQSGLYNHFKKVADSVEIPIILYNVPGRTVAELSHDTIIKLSEIPNITGIKDATGDIVKSQALIRDLPENFSVFSGDDPTAVALMLLGGSGNISVTANIIPKSMSKLCSLALQGNAVEAAKLNRSLLEIHESLFLEANPIPIKWLMFQLGLIPEGIRLPLTIPSTLTQEKLAVLVKKVNNLE